MPGSNASPRWHWLAVAAAATVVYLNSLGGGYAFDDRWIINENVLVQHGDLTEILTDAYVPGPVYRPATLLTFALEERSGWNPRIGHFTNVALHVLVTLLVFALAGRIVKSTGARLIGALIFAAHPVHTEVVANLVGRAELLAALFSLAALVAFARHVESPGRGAGWLALALISFAIGPFAKENALAVLPMFVLLDWRLVPDKPWRQRLWIPAVFAVAALPYLAARLAVTGAMTYPELFPLIDNPLAHVPPLQRVATALFILAEYIGLLVAPIWLSADYSFNQVPVVASLADPRLWIAALVLGLSGAVVWKARYSAPAIVFGAAFAACTISLTCNIAFPIGTIKGERLLYLPSVGWCIALSAVAAWALRQQAAATAAVVAAVLVLFGCRTWVRNYDWHDDASIFRATVRSSPNSAKARYNYGLILYQNGDYEGASTEYRRALAIDPQHWPAAFGIAKIYEVKGIVVGALHWYDEVLRMEWNNPKAHLQTGLLRYQLGEIDSAEAALRTGLTLRPKDPSLLLSLSSVRIEQGDRWEALRLLNAYDQLRRNQNRSSAALEQTHWMVVSELRS